MSSLYSASADIWMFLKALSESTNMLDKVYQLALKEQRECSSVCYAAEAAVQEKLQLWSTLKK